METIVINFTSFALHANPGVGQELKHPHIQEDLSDMISMSMCLVGFGIEKVSLPPYIFKL